MNQGIKLLDVVALTEDLPDRKLRRGQVGTVVELLDAAAHPNAAAHASNARCESYELMLKFQQALGKEIVKNVKLSIEIDDPMAIPYFLWDEPMSVAQLKERLRDASRPERVRLLGKILREARDTDVWKFTNPNEVRELWPELCVHLGRRRLFWEFLFKRWQIEGFFG